MGAGNVRVVAIRPLAELELEHLACGVQSVERLVDSGPAHHRIRGPYPMEELLSAGMLATLHQVRARRRSAAASVYVRARTTGPRFHSRSWPRRGFVENESP